MRKRFIIAPLLFFSLILIAAEEDLEIVPGKTLEVKFPNLKETRTGETANFKVSIPSSYTTGKLFPLCVNLIGGDGGSNPGKIFQGEDIIRVGLPYPKGCNDPKQSNMVGDFKEIWKYHKTMLDKLEELVPNIDPKMRILFGFSNGAHAADGMLAIKEFRDYFTVFILFEGGSGDGKFDQDHWVYIGYGEKGKNKPHVLAMISKAKNTKLKAVEMKDVGHELPDEYSQNSQRWALTGPLAKYKINKPLFFSYPKDATLDKTTSKSNSKEELMAYIKSQKFLKDANNKKPSLIFFYTSSRKANGNFTPETQDSLNIYDLLFTNKKGINVATTSSFFNCFQINLNKIDINDNPSLNKNTAPFLALISADGERIEILDAKTAMQEKKFFDTMQTFLSDEAKTELPTKITNITGKIAELAKIRKTAQLRIDELVNLNKKKKNIEMTTPEIDKKEEEVLKLLSDYENIANTIND